ncbi:DUF6090 family protein [Rhodohalobacter mucosus]|uniref:Uncharacterized protein n=1 Tax=Rhodohalobacter mucosus TaxID=2079485 RepID=A0A316TTC0_9BACT|nr:DUF6090 family protein [Rhodohalobacter mucosus]PWN05502.1 hypothetical protein DDZ15_12910 [Rhodohalobacter mucosus]
MVTLFRRIRQKLIDSGSVTKYLLYAIGEILLVVIGILIALQVNNWNENRINKINESLILNDLQKEFRMNQVKLDSTISYHRVLLGATNEVLDLINEPEEVIIQHNPDSLIYLTLNYFDYSPSRSVISELISSGKLSLISSDSLRMLIFDWDSALGENEEAYDTMDEMSQNLTLPYLTNNGSMKEIDQYGILMGNGGSKFESRNYLLFQELEFENHMDNQAWGITNYLDKLHRLENVINLILKHTDTQANQP